MCVKVGAASKGYPSPGLGFVLAAPEQVQGREGARVPVLWLNTLQTSCCASRAGIFGFGVGAGLHRRWGDFMIRTAHLLARKLSYGATGLRLWWFFSFIAPKQFSRK